MPQPPAEESENLPFREEQERNENNPQTVCTTKKSKLLTAVQVVGLVVALVLATYNNALLEDLAEPETEPQTLLVESEPLAPFARAPRAGLAS